MNREFLPFYALCVAFALSFIMNLLLAGLIKRRYLNYSRLLASGVEATGNILTCKEYNGKSGRHVSVMYEFYALSNLPQKGALCLPLSSLATPDEYVTGQPVAVVYLQDNPQINCPKNTLPEQVKQLKTAQKIVPILSIQSFVIFPIIFFFLYQKHAITFPF